MKFVSWNVRGLNAPKKRCLIKSQLDLMRCDVLLLQESKLNSQGVDRLFSKWKSWNFCVSPLMGASRGLAFLWKDLSVDLQLVASSPSWMLALVKSHVSNIKL